METRKRHISKSADYLTNSELTEVILNASAAIQLLEEAKPSRTSKDYFTTLYYFGLILLGGFYLAFVSKTLRNQIQENQNQLRSDLYIKKTLVTEEYAKIWNKKGYSELNWHSCSSAEGGRALNFNTDYYLLKYSPCKEIHHSFRREIIAIDQLLATLEKTIVPLITYSPELIPGIVILLYGLYQLYRTEYERLKLTNAYLTPEQKEQIKSAGIPLKLNISDRANMDDVIVAFRERVDQLKGLKPKNLKQQLFKLFSSEDDHTLPFEMESNIAQLKYKRIT